MTLLAPWRRNLNDVPP